MLAVRGCGRAAPHRVCCAAAAAAATAVPAALPPTRSWCDPGPPPAFVLPPVHLSYDAAEAEALLERHVIGSVKGGGAIVLGADTESRPMGFGGDGRVALLQLATPSAVVLLPLQALAPPASSPGADTPLPPLLARLLARSNTFLVGVRVRDDAALLARGCAAPLAATAVDVALAAVRCGVFAPAPGEVLNPASIGLATLIAALGGPVLSKSRSVTLSNWERAPLSEAQVQYAAVDAYVSGWAAAQVYAAHAARCAVAGAPPPPPLPAWLAAEAVLQAADEAASAARAAAARKAIDSVLSRHAGGLSRGALLSRTRAALPREKESYVRNTIERLIRRGVLARAPGSSGSGTWVWNAAEGAD